MSDKEMSGNTNNQKQAGKRTDRGNVNQRRGFNYRCE